MQRTNAVPAVSRALSWMCQGTAIPVLLPQGNSVDHRRKRLFTEREIQMLFRHRQRELLSPWQPLREIWEPIEVHCVEFERLYAMDPLPAKPCRQLHGVLVRINGYARRRLARPMQSHRVRGADINPRFQHSRQVA